MPIPLLTLNHSTLFYWMLSNDSNNKRKHTDAIKEWSSVISNGKPTSRATYSVTSSSTTPSLTGGASRSSAPSVLTDNVKVISHRTSETAKVKPDLVSPIILHDNGGLSDNDEMKGEEREVAIASPPKGKKRLTSEVRKIHLFNMTT